MISKEILQAVKTGEISLAEAEKALVNKKKLEIAKEYSGKSDNRIAIIGMAGQFPKADDLDTYWNNLVHGIDCIAEVPPTRWSIDRYYDPDPRTPGKTYSKWFGMVEDVDKFDPLFFNISPIEAELMDPQQRLFLQNCWHCIEDAGIKPEKLSGSRCGVFVGCGMSDYGQIVGGQELNAQNLTGRSPSILSARISYILNLKGPCLAIDTACSSALVAISEACSSLTAYSSDLALAGGVNVLAGPSMHIMTSKAGMLSPDGRCYTFDNRANGFVPGEGAGAVLLKRLSDAVRDQDHIYGVIIGWGVNQDGKTNGITAPSANSQIQLEKDVYERFGINPESITLVEAHGTGTKLGDPIEVEALIESFRSFTPKKSYCALGSVKSNIGHLMKAAGVPGMIKILLAMRHRMIPPTINYEKLNEYIALENSPFYINTELQPWKVSPGIPRRACISSFGMSGTNAHLVIEEYTTDTTDVTQITVNKDNLLVFVLSAKNKEQLKTYAQNMKRFIESHADLNLADVAYTLQIGREAMDHRLAFLVDSRENLLRTLEGFIDNDPAAEIFAGKVKKHKDGPAAFPVDDGESLLQNLLQNKELKKIAKLWVNGSPVDWELLYSDIKPRCISLPVYPFAKESYWITGQDSPQTGTDMIHPLLHQNTSDLAEQRFSSIFTGQEFFLEDHKVRGQRVLPGVAYLEMARKAVEQAIGTGKDEVTAIQLKNVVWARSIVVEDQPVKINIGLYPEANGEIAYEIYSEPETDGEEPVVYSQGSAVLTSTSSVPALDIEALKGQCTHKILTSAQCYEFYRSLGLEYGPGHRGIEMVYVGLGQALAKLSLPSAISNTIDQFVLHPGLMDSALQAKAGLVMGESDSKLTLPFALQELEIIGKCTSSMWAFIRHSEDGKPGDKLQKYDLDLCDDQGNIYVRIKGFTSRVLDGKAGSAKNQSDIGTLMMYPYWREEDIIREVEAPDYSKRLVMLCEVSDVSSESIAPQISGVNCIALQSEHQEINKRFEDYTAQIFSKIQKILRDKPKGKELLQVVISGSKEHQLFSGFTGLLKTAQLENPHITGQLLEIEPGEDSAEILKILEENSCSPFDSWVRYQAGQRYIRDWSEVPVSPEAAGIPWKDRGVYLITGGAGGLGLIFAKEIASRVKGATLILTGRSQLNEDKQAQIKEIEKMGAQVEYKQADFAEKAAVNELIQSILANYENLHGIIHSAGVIIDNFIIKKTNEDLFKVMAPKVTGLVNLDEATKKLPLDFIIIFSSRAGVFGNVGQADYSAANAFMDAYAQFRNGLVAAKERHGHTLSINWPLWKEGGMRINEEDEKLRKKTIGMTAMETSSGIQALYQAFASGKEQIVAIEGDRQLLKAALFTKPADLENYKSATALESKKPSKGIKDNAFKEKVVNYLKEVLSSVFKLPPHKIEEDASMEKYGIDSIMIMSLTNELEKTFGSLPKTLFFEYQNIEELAGYFLESYREKLTEILGNEEKKPETIEHLSEPEIETDLVRTTLRRQGRSRFAFQSLEQPEEKIKDPLDIAIIGLAGRYPGARNIKEFWQVLRDGQDCITEIPKERWDHSLYFDEDRNKKGKTYSKWGGFIDGVDEFDPLFFNISPKEAEIMDPQERLFLQCAYEALEDAGYTRESLDINKNIGSAGNAGVFVGVMREEYQLYGVQETILGRPIALAGNSASIANRVSYFCNFHGPSMAVNTMCSSSITAIHLACQTLQRGVCQLAIAGGVNVSVHPNKYLQLAQGKFASSKGRCESFGLGGDGYVPGEGVGAVILKQLSQAIADGDQIYGIIKATSINHGGKTNGYAVPNPNLQAGVIGNALQEAGINPRAISYIEAHGTGTSLGDPIEIAGLSKAFQEHTKDRQFCAIGSVKSNIGHGESAAGIAAITKVLLQLKHGQLVPSLHAQVLNPNIDFANSPFKVQQDLAEWKRPIIDGREIPRQAGISSFGAGGANAHVVIQEYLPQKKRSGRQVPVTNENPVMIVLSARNEEQLREQAERLLAAVQEQHFSQADLANVSYTLQIGREAMEERLAMVVGAVNELEAKLIDFLEGRASIENLYRGQVRQNKETVTFFTADEDLQKAIESWVVKRKYGKLLDLWVKGLSFDWSRLYGNEKPSRISLPTYPFARERYWVSENPNQSVDGNWTNLVRTATIHPLLHQNTSDFYEQRFSSTFTGQEFFLRDHLVKGQHILPGVAYLEMARKAVEQATGDLENGPAAIRLKNIVWARPVSVGKQSVKVHIGLYPQDNEEIAYEIYSWPDEDDAEPVVHSQGTALPDPGGKEELLDLDVLRKQCSLSSLLPTQCYQAFKEKGIEYGPGHRGIEQIYVGEKQVLAKLSLPSCVADTQHHFVLHPGIMDAALQASIGLMLTNDAYQNKPSMPFALQEIEILNPCTANMWVHIQFNESSKAGDKLQKLDLVMCDEQGYVCIRMKGFTTRVLENEFDKKVTFPTTAPLLVTPYWKEQTVPIETSAIEFSQHMTFLCELAEKHAEQVKAKLNGTRCIILHSSKKGIDKRFQDYAQQLFEEIQKILKDKTKGNVIFQIVIPSTEEKRVFTGFTGLLKTARLENPKLVGQLIEVEPGEVGDDLAEFLKENSRSPYDIQVRYMKGKRFIKDWREIEDFSKKIKIPWKEQGVYLITGGAGGLGLIFAKEIAHQVKNVTLVLTGRSSLSEDKKAQLKEVEKQGNRVEYKQVDVKDKKSVGQLIRNIKEEFGRINGIIHSAGVIRDSFIIKKTTDEFSEVLAPKVTGLVNLDEASKDLNLDFFICFSSGAGAKGNIGQADYACANAFMDAFAAYRNVLAAGNRRQGQTLSINWPLWKEGGMHIDKETEKMLKQNDRITVLGTSDGIQALYGALASGKDQIMVTADNRSYLITGSKDISLPNQVQTIEINDSCQDNMKNIEREVVRERAAQYLKKLLAAVIKLPPHKIQADVSMEKYGIDSVMVLQLTNELEKTFGSLSKTLFFEYQNIQELTNYFLKSYWDQMIKLLGFEEKPAATIEKAKEAKAVAESVEPKFRNHRRSRFISQYIDSTKDKAKEAMDIAIIGVAGRYPGAGNILEYWRNLRDGKDCITEIPQERWDHSLYFDEDKNKAGKTYSKWGGFIDNVDRFDPLFFNITPREAEFMDPQERLFLQCAYETLEDAGYSREALGSYQSFGLGGNVGVYVGVMYEEYKLYGIEEQILGRPIALNGNPSSIANRFSYFCNFHGPSMAVDTMCSSSLTAIHLACQSIKRGECELAVAGGVNVSIHPNKYLALGQGKFVSSKGRCESFGQGGDGYVPGEGVGAVLLKPLSQAIADGDHIYGIIKAIAINHGGKTNGYTVPNPNAQASLIQRVFNEADIDPRTISYIEAHGTGTSLGDPIEIAGLNKAFQEYTKDRQFCAIGSAKSNIGHCESAAGIAGVTKVLLQLKYGHLAPSLHSQILNPNIDFDNTPFVVQQELASWKRPVINGQEVPRRAGISAFGAGGANAHILIEEYIPQSQEQPQIAVSVENPVIITLSAKNGERLKEQAEQILVWLDEEKLADRDLASMAYTLQVGREALEERLAVMVSSITELTEKLKGFVKDQDNTEGLYYGRVKQNDETLAALLMNTDMTKTIDDLIIKGNYGKIADLWVLGLNIDWNKLYGDTKPRRISLPTYPFARERYWIPEILITDEFTQSQVNIYKKQSPGNPELITDIDVGTLKTASVKYLKNIIAEVTKISVNSLDPETSFEKLGLDSIMITQLNAKIEQWIGKLDATLFFKYNSIHSLGAYLATAYPEVIAKLVANKRTALAQNQVSLPAASTVKPSLRPPELYNKKEHAVMDIAIIGAAGKYPQAETLEQFWHNLYQGKDCIEEIPSSRWLLDGFYEPDRTKAVAQGLSYSKWGGFLDDIDKFDPLFFNIAPKDAIYMDPHIRLFLQAAWACLEDAGYTRNSLQEDSYGNQIGVFVGASFNNYQLLVADAAGRSNQDMYAVSSQIFSIANRVSHVMNFTGPSLTVDTACSSSLYAIHLACESMRSGQSRMAVVGGVNLSLHPSKYINLSQGLFNANDGRCRAFCEGGTGYVPAEAVGAVFLKPLREAVKDNDHIYGIIKGTAASHAGKTNGYTVPNPVSQSLAIEKALMLSQVHPRSISCVEAHGTGTALGDPIELTGLTDVFKKYTSEKRFCAISSVKSNIGHAEAAAGIAQLTKVILQLKHQTLVKNLMHGDGLNPNIDFEQTPFVVQQELAEWKRPIIDGLEVPRRAGISSFGAGGANAHVVIEEYIPSQLEQPQITITAENPAIIVLSAKNEERLKEQAERLLGVIGERQYNNTDLAAMAYTLQVGREAMEERLAMVVGSIKDLEDKLRCFMKGQSGIEDLYRGQVKRNKETVAVLAADEEMQETVAKWLERRKYTKVLELWVKGLNIDWNRLYGDVKPNRTSLPTYPFAKERYWVHEGEKRDGDSSTLKPLAVATAIHPLLHQNTSDFYEQRFSSTFTGQEFFLADHVVNKERIMPGVAYLEMARTAVEKAAGIIEKEKTGIRLKNVVWARPISVAEKPVRVHIGLYPEENQKIAYEVYSQSEEIDVEPVVHSQGNAEIHQIEEISALNLKELQAQCSQNTFTAKECYEIFEKAGLDYGPGHRGIERIHVGDGQVLAKLTLPPSVHDTKDRFVLHPSIMDAALQASIMIGTGNSKSSESTSSIKLSLPFALLEVEILNKSTSSRWAFIRYSDGSKAGDKVKKTDIDLCDEQGNVCVQMKGFSSRVLEGESIDTLLLAPGWKEQAVVRGALSPDYEQHVVMLCEIGKASAEEVESRIKGVRCITLQAEGSGIEERFQGYAVHIFEKIQSIIKDKPKGKVLIQVVIPQEGEQQLLAGLSGIIKTARKENPKLLGQLIEIEAEDDLEGILEKLTENSQSQADIHIRYQKGKRLIANRDEVEVSHQAVSIPWKDKGVYLITGGAGELGLIFAKEIAQQVSGATLILTGRSSLGKEKQIKLEELEALGAKIIYKQVDVTDKKSVEELIQNIRQDMGGLSGIIHAAGIIRDNFIIKKTSEEFRAVLDSKVAGLVNLDQASKDLSLDFFILFSSVVGPAGNPGQADYSCANAFMDGYAKYRNELAVANQRQGQTLSVNWPLWKEGGMHVDEESEKRMRSNSGMVTMRTEAGITALYKCLICNKDQVMVAEGDVSQMRRKLLMRTEPVTAQPQEVLVTSDSAARIETGSLQEKVQGALIQSVSNLLKVRTEDIDVDAELGEYGFDSITLTQLTNTLNEKYRLQLTPTIFFEYSTLNSFTEYLTTEHQDVFAAQFGVPGGIVTPAPVQARLEEQENQEKTESPLPERRRPRFARAVVVSPFKPDKTVPEPIAIVGMSGTFPMAGDLDEFWTNLVEGRDCITEIPPERWDWREYYGDPVKEANKTNIKWGGFIDGVDEFDPRFFGISPREAELMDPQQRLLMTYSWKAIEDAGYAAQSLSGTKTAIFVGTGSTGYSGLISQANVAIEGYTSIGAVPSVGPNRMSYFLNIHGPSEPIETACSSSLIAIHRAVGAIRDGNCEMAVAGGVNTIVTPSAYISFSKAGMLSPDGRCKTFSDGADGYVRGEGVGMLFLKKLQDAERSGDCIYGVIRGTAENHGGRANSLTAPNPKAQAELLKTAYTNAGIDLRTVGYIEAHGTGTALGDPIEINGLKTAFKELYQATGEPQFNGVHCGLGSVKTNIGHLELAAGIAGVIKVLLQLKHKTLVKSLHCDTINPYIQLEDSPFYIVRENREWEALKDAENRELPRRAGVSSFGFGGANAHVVIEEYIPSQPERPQITITAENPALIVLSAKNEERLKEQAEQLLAAIGERKLNDADLAAMAYTLQVGRETMEERLAMVAGSIKDLEDKLKRFTEGQSGIEDLYRGQVKRNKETVAVLAADEEMQETVAKWIERRKYTKVLELWVKGLNIDWNRLYGDVKPNRISLPTYPFAKEHYWVPQQKIKPAENVAIKQVVTASIQPVIDGNSIQAEKPKGILLDLLPGKQKSLGKKVVQTQQSIKLSPVNISSAQTRNAEQTKLITHVQEAVSEESLEEALAASLAEILSMKQSEIDVDEKFVDMGLDSITGVEWIQAVNKRYGTSIAATRVYDYPSIREFAKYLEGELDKSKITLTTSLNISRRESDSMQVKNEQMVASISTESIEERLTASLAEILSMKQSEIDVDEKFVDMGLDSITGVEWIQAVNRQYGLTIAATKVYDYPNIREFAGYVEKELGKAVPVLSLDEVLQQVQQGTLEADQANQLFQQIYIQGGTR